MEEAGSFECVTLPCDSDRSAWYSFCFGRQSAAASAAASAADPSASDGGATGMAVDGEGAEDGQGRQPTLPVLLSMEPVSILFCCI